MPANLLFALDIGTRNVVGIVAEVVGNKINILASERLEHQTRAMLDGQIHDIPQVVLVIKEIKEKYRKAYGVSDVKESVKIDASLLGGVKVKIGDKVIDGTLKGRLDSLKDMFLK